MAAAIILWRILLLNISILFLLRPTTAVAIQFQKFLNGHITLLPNQTVVQWRIKTYRLWRLFNKPHHIITNVCIQLLKNTNGPYSIEVINFGTEVGLSLQLFLFFQCPFIIKVMYEHVCWRIKFSVLILDHWMCSYLTDIYFIIYWYNYLMYREIHTLSISTHTLY